MKRDFNGLKEKLTNALDGRSNRWSVNWQAQYNAACFYSQASSERKALIDLALERLAKALNDPENQLSSGWLCADPDLEPLREDPQGAFLNKECDDQASTHGGSPKMLRGLRLAWVLLAKAADQRGNDWIVDRKADSEKWTGVQGRDLEAWCQAEADSWGRLLHWAQRPEDEGRRLEFWQTVAESDAASKLPNLELPRDGIQGTEDEHKELWAALADCAARQRDTWDKLEDQIRKAVLRGTTSSIDGRRVPELAEEAGEIWLALKDWAQGPHEARARSYFMRRGGCEDRPGRVERIVNVIIVEES